MKAEIGMVRKLSLAGLSALDIERLIKIGRRLSRLDERACNGEIDHEAYERKAESLLKRAESIITERAADTPILRRCRVYHQSDPRGCSLYLYDEIELGRRNIDAHYSSIGIGIY